jgi:hypothetical protein
VRRAIARRIDAVVAAYPRAHTIHLVMDNLNTHCEKSLIDHFGPRTGPAVWRRLTVHYTPKHGADRRWSRAGTCAPSIAAAAAASTCTSARRRCA